jgi:DNA-binding CsgD family transcriptional regulator
VSTNHLPADAAVAVTAVPFAAAQGTRDARREATVAHFSTDKRVMPDLTARETEVIALIASGLSNASIGKRLSISEHTAKFHVNNILLKLDTGSRTHAAVRALRLGFIA